MTIDYTIKISDILTAVLTFLTIVISVITLAQSLSKDRYLRQKEQSDLVRSAAAKVLAKLDRLQAIQLSLFNTLQPIFIETSEILIKNSDVDEARDYLWKKVNSERTLITAKILDEQIETAYIELCSHFSDIRDIFTKALIQIEVAEEKVLADFLMALQQDVLSFENKQIDYTTAKLGNALRRTASHYSSCLKHKTNIIALPVQGYLFNVIAMSDEEILSMNSRNTF